MKDYVGLSTNKTILSEYYDNSSYHRNFIIHVDSSTQVALSFYRYLLLNNVEERAFYARSNINIHVF